MQFLSSFISFLLFWRFCILGEQACCSLALFFPQLLYYCVIARPVLLCFCFYFIPPFISTLCYFILLLHPVASYYTALFLQKDCLLQTLDCPSLYLALFPQSRSSEDPRNLTDLWNTASLRSCQSCLTVVDWNDKTKARKGKSKKKGFWAWYLQNNSFVSRLSVFFAMLKLIPRRTPLYFVDACYTGDMWGLVSSCAHPSAEISTYSLLVYIILTEHSDLNFACIWQHCS